MTVHRLPIVHVPRTEIATWIESAGVRSVPTGSGDKHVISLKTGYHKRVTFRASCTIDAAVCGRTYTTAVSPQFWDPTVLCEKETAQDSCYADLSDSASRDFHIVLGGTVSVGSELIPLPSYHVADTRFSW